MRIAVTGASGFIGGRVACALEAAGHQIWSYGRRESAALTTRVPYYSSWDIATGPRDLAHVDAIVHCAAQVGQWGSLASYDTVNVQGTRHVVESVSRRARVIYVSSGSVYHTHHATAYARTKLQAEAIVMAEERSAIVLRPHIVYGPGDTTLWPRVREARRGTLLFLPGDGKNRVSVTHVDNLVHSIERSLAASHVGGVFDIADRESPTMRELLKTMFARHGVPVRIRTLPRSVAWSAATVFEALWRVLRRSGDPPLTRYLVQSLADPFTRDIGPAGRELGYAPIHGFRDGPL